MLLRTLSLHRHAVDILAQERVEGRLDDRGVAETCRRLDIQIVSPDDLRAGDEDPGARCIAAGAAPFTGVGVCHGR